MDEKEKNSNLGRYIGYILMFFIFTTILYFLLTILEKLPASWNYFNILLIVLMIVFIGKIIKYWLNKP